ncbi:MAG: ABC transporter permease [Thermoanaerobaculaceae bacterium]|nr:ABC transporter permease [Thermoanaerobaculaceae bacterium]MDI9621083.1 ABC transporter permease [Acidobacteriota bacterium]HPW55518.1 ABC transporter permease [Thermoanaerobaculaceae bacterium]
MRDDCRIGGMVVAEVCRNVAGKRPTPWEDVRDVASYWHLLANLVHRDLTVRYKRSILGFFWTLLNPLLMMVILTVVFSHFFRFAILHYEIYFLSEFLVWMFFAQTTANSMASLAWNGPLMKRVRLPKTIFALAGTVAGMINLLLSCGPLIAIMLVVGAPVRPALLVLPLSFLVIAVFTLGVSLGLSALAVYFDDVAQMYQVGIMGLMYLTPIMYPLDILPDRFRWLVEFNPLTKLFELARYPIYHGQLPPLAVFGVGVALALGALVLGWTVFRRLAGGFYLHL